MLKPILLFSAALAIAFTAATIPGGSSQESAQQPAAATGPMAADATNPVKPTAEGLQKAKALYQIDCALCHGDNGNGQTDVAKSMELTMADFTDPKTLAGKKDGELFDIIRNGKDKMPPEAAGRANDTLVWNLISYLRRMSNGSTAPAVQ